MPALFFCANEYKMATPISEFRDGIRVLIGDIHADNQLYEDGHIDTAVKMLVRGGSFSGFTLTNADADITPTIDDPNLFGLIYIKAARQLLIPHASRMSVRQPGLSVMTGGKKDTLWILSHDAYQKEMTLASRKMFDTYQDLFSWLSANTNSKYFWSKMEVNEDIPVDTVSVGLDGTYFGN